MLLISSNVYYRIVFVSLYVIITLEYSIIRRYTNIVYFYYLLLLLLTLFSYYQIPYFIVCIHRYILKCLIIHAYAIFLHNSYHACIQ